MTRWILLPLAALLALGFVLGLKSEPADALPFYAQRSGRTCANCHVSPTLEDEAGWENPELAERKCTMSCTSCHLDPTGGGQRNASGRYYGQSTLAMLHTQDRSYSDHGRELLGNDLLWKAQNLLGEPADVAQDERLIPSTREDWEAGMGQGQTGNWAAMGTPLTTEPVMAFWDGRYDDLDADPMLQVGGDFRLAWWSATRTGFPMQADLHAGFHPVHHLMFVGTLAARGRTTGGVYSPPIFPRRAFVMVNELPYFAYAKAGIFMPDYGVFVEDHTRFTREMFEMDLSTSQDTVLGVQVGATPNYPTLSASLFANDTSWLDGGEKDEGWGATVNGGWRDLGWTVTGHAMHKQRRGLGRGNLSAVGVGWGLNPAYYWERIPATLTGEMSLGHRSWATGKSETYVASTAQLDWIVRNGINLQITGDHAIPALSSPVLRQRYGATLQVPPTPGLTFSATGRQMWEGNTNAGRDVLLQTHVWF